jgi:predicted dehydrogenase
VSDGRVGIALAGFGYWGPNLARNVVACQDTKLVAICDRDPDRRALASRLHPSVAVVSDWSEALTAPDVEAAVIATPVASHLALAELAIDAEKHLLIEKPLAATAEDARRLVAAAHARNLALMVDHTFLYTGAVRRLREIVGSGELGELRFFDSTRVSLGLIQSDVSALWDLAVHDLTILEYVTGRWPTAASATGAQHDPSPQPSCAFVTLYYDDTFIAHVNVNWLSPVKIRRTLVCGNQKMAVLDDLESSEKLKVYDAGYDAVSTAAAADEHVGPPPVRRRVGDVWSPLVDDREALLVEIAAFATYVRGGEVPHNDGRSGVAIIEILEAAAVSMALRGEPVEITYR